MVPHAISHVGSQIGPYIGHTPDRLALADRYSTWPRPASSNRPPTCLLAGSLGSGKTIFLELAGLAGLPAGLRARSSTSTRRATTPRAAAGRRGPDRDDRALRRGALPRPARPDADRRRGDPRGPDLQLPRSRSCPPRSSRSGRPQLRLAVSEAAAAGARSCGEVVAGLAGGRDADADRSRLARSRSTAQAGLARLGLGGADTDLPRGRRRAAGQPFASAT